MSEQNALKLTAPDSVPRETDPNVLQRRAANPDSSAWVGASAGSGKTKVLTDRMIRLMLPGADGRPGSDPGAILALTFTKAGANEMAQRLSRRLAAWAVMDDAALAEDLGRNLFGEAPTPEQMRAARQLFARVVDAPGGMRIMTIHSFCGSVLGRFPLEAGLPPHFTALEDGQDTLLLDRARDSVLAQAAGQPGSPLGQALHHIAGLQGEDQFAALLRTLASERRQLGDILRDHFGPDGVYAQLCRHFDLPPGASAESLIEGAGPADEGALRTAVRALVEGGGAEDSKRGQSIQAWLDAPKPARAALYADYKSAYLTGKGELRARMATKGAVAIMPDVADILGAEGNRLLTLDDSIKAAQVAAATRDLLILGDAILKAYADLKEARAALDFDDLIIRTLALLQGRTMGMSQKDVAPWVRFKLDQGIDHILIDEAQDTNPEQWAIVRALTEEFFAGSGSREDAGRTLFVVGDEKQSIFSFQRAEPRQMGDQQDWYAARIAAAGETLEDVPLNTSFRSTPAILRAVDSVFEPPEMRKGLGRNVRPHAADRRRQPGLVELWPLKKDDDAEEPENGDTVTEGWDLPVSVTERQSGAARLCAQIADTIDGWIRTKEILPSRGRAIQPGDILILMRTRTPFVGQLVRALKNRNIDVSGVDRMVLKDQLAVEDLTCAASFALLPDDDLALAGLLKSPFVGWDDEALYALAQPRGENESLWAALRKGRDTPLQEWLSALIRRAAADHPYEFFSRLLQEHCPADNVSGLRAIRGRLGADALDPLDEFLNRTLTYETGALPTLQGFLHWHASEASDIKRQMEEESAAVRIMTVHASKGLQAPIVILPDTVRGASSRKADRILWPDRSDFPLPVFLPTKTMMPAALGDACDTVAEKQEEEYLRLLYVAMTRAEDRLYAGGYTGKKAPLDLTWHGAIRAGLERLPETETTEDENGAVTLRLSNPALTDEADRKGKDHAVKRAASAAPSWLRAPAPEEPTPPRPLVPSRPSGPLPPAASPRAAKDVYRFRRGTLTHTLLQYLPDLPFESREAAAAQFIGRAGPDLPQDVREGIVRETMAVLRHPQFAPIFGPESRAEISVTGLLDDATLISGQIDRLLVTDKEILIVDYKTNRPPPQRVEDVPAIYMRQMQAYARAMEKIYPGRAITCALLWTDGATLMPLGLEVM